MNNIHQMRNQSLSTRIQQSNSHLSAPVARNSPPAIATPSKGMKTNIEQHCYVVEKILDKRGSGDNAYFLIKWAGYDESESTWEPRSNLITCEDALKEFNNRRSQEIQAQLERRKRASESQNNRIQEKKSNGNANIIQMFTKLQESRRENNQKETPISSTLPEIRKETKNHKRVKSKRIVLDEISNSEQESDEIRIITANNFSSNKPDPNSKTSSINSEKNRSAQMIEFDGENDSLKSFTFAYKSKAKLNSRDCQSKYSMVSGSSVSEFKNQNSNNNSLIERVMIAPISKASIEIDFNKVPKSQSGIKSMVKRALKISQHISIDRILYFKLKWAKDVEVGELEDKYFTYEAISHINPRLLTTYMKDFILVRNK